MAEPAVPAAPPVPAAVAERLPETVLPADRVPVPGLPADRVPVSVPSVDRVLALAPDAAAQRAAQRLAAAAAWAETGCAGDEAGIPPTVWGLARGSGALPYQTAVESGDLGFRCSCPSRKVPCKHVLGLLLRWSAGAITAGPVPGWIRAWHDERARRAARAAVRAGGAGRVPAEPGQDGYPADAGQDDAGRAPGAGQDDAGRAPGTGQEDTGQAPGTGQEDTGQAPGTGQDSGGQVPAGTTRSRRPGERALAQRAERIGTGLAELDRWLADQVRSGIAGLTSAGYEPWDTLAARLVDAKAATVAGVVRRIAAVATSPDRLLAELGLLRLLIAGYQRLDALPADLADTVRARAGIPVTTEQVLTDQPAVTDEWHVLGIRDEQEDQLLVRRAWLRGARSGSPGLVLAFAGPGQSLGPDAFGPGSLGTGFEGDLCFYPGARRLRALVAGRRGPVLPAPAPSGTTVEQALREYAAALADDPWLERWPMTLAGVVPVADGARWYLAEADGSALPVDPASGDPWRLVGACGGHPATVTGEWSTAGLRPLTAWPEGRLVAL